MAPSGEASNAVSDSVEQRRVQLIDLVRADYDATRAFIDSVVLTATAVRTVGVTVSLALLGYAVAHSSVAVAVCALVAVALFLFLDAYHGWLYDQARRHVRETEKVLRLRYRQLEAGDDEPEAVADLERALASHELGPYLGMTKFKLEKLFQARPRQIYAGLYGGLALLAVAAAIYGAAT
jgi:uncharacterized membrane protein